MPSRSKKPAAAVLRDLYLGQKLSGMAIAERLGVTRKTVGIWLKSLGLATHRGNRYSMASRGRAIPTKEELERLHHGEHMSQKAIGDRYGVAIHSVSKWMRMHGIRKASRLEIRLKGRPIPPGDEVRGLYESGVSIDEIAAACGVSQPTAYRLLREGGAAIRPLGVNGPSFTCSDGHVVRSGYEQRVDDWLSSREVEHIYEPRLPFRAPGGPRADFWANGWFVEVWGLVGVPKYDAKMARKRTLYLGHSLPLIEVYPEDVRRGPEVLDRVLRPCLSPAPTVAPAAVEAHPRGGEAEPACPAWLAMSKAERDALLGVVGAFGETKSLIAWSEDPRCLVTLASLRDRLRKGWPPEEAMATARLRPPRRTYEGFGESRSLADWSRDPRCIVPYDAMIQRITALGWNVEDAIAVPVGARRGDAETGEDAGRVPTPPGVLPLRWD
jgi:AcrR family transcriptional regulator